MQTDDKLEMLKNAFRFSQHIFGIHASPLNCLIRLQKGRVTPKFIKIGFCCCSVGHGLDRA